MSNPSTIVLITGANSGIGFAAAGVIVGASEKYHVILASRNAENGEKAVKEIEAKGDIKGTVSTVQLDQTDRNSVERAAKAVEQQFGRVDVLVNNAAIASQNPDTQAAMEENFRTNVMGASLVAETFYPLVLKSKRPYSIYVSSGLGSLGLAADPSSSMYTGGYPEYSISKSALNMWALHEYRTYGPKGVKTFMMCPGLVISNLRGKSEESRSAGGNATSPVVSGQTMLSIIEGKRDADVGKFVHKDGTYPW